MSVETREHSSKSMTTGFVVRLKAGHNGRYVEYFLCTSRGLPSGTPGVTGAIKYVLARSADREMTLADRYDRECPFSLRDLVTPRAGVGLDHVGVPYVVLEVLDDPIRTFVCDTPVTSLVLGYGRRLDGRIARRRRDGEVSTFWVESWRLEEYSAPAAKVA